MQTLVGRDWGERNISREDIPVGTDAPPEAVKVLCEQGYVHRRLDTLNDLTPRRTP
jgi:hypothetical protein